MLHDVAAPVTASRFYAYALLGAYEVAYFAKGNLPNINEKFNVNPGIKPPPVPKNFNLSFASSYAMLEVGRNIMPSGAMLIENQKNLLAFFKKKKKISEADLTDNVRYAEEIAKYVIAYAKTDGYNKLSTYTAIYPQQRKKATGTLPLRNIWEPSNRSGKQCALFSWTQPHNLLRRLRYRLVKIPPVNFTN